MPELPEVETVRIGLSRLLPGLIVKDVHILSPKSFTSPYQDRKAFVIAAKVVQVKRRAKVLMVELSSGYSLIIHLKMTGQLVFQNNNLRFGAGHPSGSLINQLPDKSTRVIFAFLDGSHLFFNDQRKFGWIKLLPTSEVPNIDFMKKYGPEPLDKKFTWQVLRERLQHRPRSNVKAVLLDQTIIAGLGNIYTDESLWASKIHPQTVVQDLSLAKIKSLHRAIIEVLLLSLKKGGSTDRNYVDAEGQKGNYLKFANVFRRNGQSCPRCGAEIVKIKVAGRGTHFCPECQKLLKPSSKRYLEKKLFSLIIETMVITLTGENDFSLMSALTTLKTDFVLDHGAVSIEYLDGRKNDFSRIQEGIQSPSFLSQRKMIVLNNPSSNQHVVDSIEGLINDLPETIELVIVEPKIDKRTVFYKTLKKRTDFREFNKLAVYDLSHWLAQTAQLKGGYISQTNATILVDRVGTDQQLLNNELEKLLLFNSDITRETIELLTEPTPQNTIFKILDAAFVGDLRRSIKIYHEQRIQSVDPSKIIALLAWQLRVLALIKAASSRSIDEIAQQAKMNPNVIRNHQVLAKSVSFEHIKKLISSLLTIDVRSKSEGIDLDEALQLFLLQVKT